MFYYVMIFEPMIMPGAEIGGRTLVTKNVGPYTIVGRGPARLIKNRFSEEVIKTFLEIKCWNWGESILLLYRTLRRNVFRKHWLFFDLIRIERKFKQRLFLVVLCCIPAFVSAQVKLFQKNTIVYQNLVPIYSDDSLQITYRFANDDIRLLNVDTAGGNIRIYRNGSLIKTFKEPLTNFQKDVDSVQAADLNGDGRPDFKITAFIRGASPLSSLVRRKVFLLSKGETFRLVAYTDFYNEAERDLDGDNKFEMIVKNLTAFKGYNYWDYQLYYLNSKGDIVNISRRFGFPVLIRFSGRQDNQPYMLSPTEKQRLTQKQTNDFMIIN